MATPNAVFNEVLQVQIDVPRFIEDLQKLEAAYEDFVTRVNSKGFGAGSVMDAQAFSQLNSSIGQIQEHIQEMDASAVQSAEQMETAFTGAVAKISAQLQSLNQGQVDSAAKSAKGVVGVNQGAAAQSLGFWNNFFQNMNVNWGALFANVVKYAGAYALVNAAINAVIGVIEGAVNAVKDGLKYLEEFETRTAQVQSILSNPSVGKFSSDLVSNFKLAGDAAKVITQQLEDIGAKLNIPFDTVTKVFDVFAQSGGISAVGGDLEKAVKTVGLLMAGFQAVGVPVDNVRRVTQEITSLFSGQVGASSKLTTIFGENNVQLTNQLKTVIQQGQLYEFIQGKLSTFGKYFDDSTTRAQGLSGVLDLVKQRVEGALAGPLFDHLKDVGQQLLQYFEQHKSLIMEIARAVGEVVLQFVELIENSVKMVSQSLALKLALAAVVLVLGEMVIGFSTVAKIAASIGDFLSHPTNFIKSGAWKDLGTQIGTAIAVGVKDSFDLGKALSDAAGITKPEEEKPSAIPAFKAAPPRPPKANPKELSSLNKELTDQIDAVKEAQEDLRNATKVAMEDRSISVQQGTTKIIQSYKDEQEQITALIKAALEKRRQLAAEGFDKETLDARDHELSAKQHQENRTVDTGVANTEREAAKDTIKLNKELLDQQNSDFQLNIQSQIAAIKQAAQEGYISQSDALQRTMELEQKAHNEKMSFFDQEGIAAGKNTVEQARVAGEQIQETIAFNAKQKTDEAELKALREQEYVELLNNVAKLAELDAARRNQEIQTQIALNGGSRRAVGAANVQVAQNNVNSAQARVSVAREQAQFAGINNLDAEKQRAADVALQEATLSLAEAQAQLTEAIQKQNSEFSDLIQGSISLTNGLKTIFDEFKGGNLNAGLSGLFNNLSKAFSDPTGVQGFMNKIFGSDGPLAGVFDKIGGFVDKTLGKIPGIGGLFSLGASVFGFISDIFTAAAKRIAQQIQASVKNITDAYTNGTSTLVQTIEQLQAERASAIQQLSGKKGGQDQLNSLLPQIDQQIASLQNQQQQTFVSFENTLSVLKLQGGALADLLQQWQQINTQVQQYINAGGDAAKATEFISDSLQQILQTNLANLNQAQTDSINDALQLNNLLQQRLQLNQQLFDAQNADALEKRNNAVDLGIQAQTTAQQLQQQLQSVNSQIDLYTKRVAMEKQVFNIATDTATLQAQANQLNLDALTLTIQKWQQMQQIVAGIVQNANGLFSLSPALQNLIGLPGSALTTGPQVNIQNLTVNVDTGGAPADASTGAAVGDGIIGVLSDESRFGTATL